LADVAPWLNCLAILAAMLQADRQDGLRAVLDSLQLDVVSQPADSAVDVAAALDDLGGETAPSAAKVGLAD